MVEQVEFANFITKDFKIEKGDENRRIFSGHITSEVVDRQNEFVFVKEVMNIMEVYMSIYPAMSEVHSNRNVAKVLSYEKSEIEGHPSVKITGEVYKHPMVKLYDQVWEKILKGEYRGLSMGGASKDREPIVKDGRLVMSLKNLELYEIAICPTPANPFAIIDNVNMFAKASGLSIRENGGKSRIQCNGVYCSFEKGGTDSDVDVDIDNKQPEDKKPVEKSLQELITDEVKKQLEQFNKPEEKEEKKEEIEKQNKEEVKEVIEEEHEKLGEKPDEKEKKVHDELIREAKKSQLSLEISILKNSQEIRKLL